MVKGSAPLNENGASETAMPAFNDFGDSAQSCETCLRSNTNTCAITIAFESSQRNPSSQHPHCWTSGKHRKGRISPTSSDCLSGQVYADDTKQDRSTRDISFIFDFDLSPRRGREKNSQFLSLPPPPDRLHSYSSEPIYRMGCSGN